MKKTKKTTTAKKPTSQKKPLSKAKSKTPAPVVKSTGFWLMKSEPESYSIDHFKRDHKTLWTGVRNYQARNFMMHSMVSGDEFLFYHSSAEPPAVVGVGKITRVNLPDPSAQDAKSSQYDPKSSPDHPIWFCAEVEFKGKLKTQVTLEEIRSTPSLKKMALLSPGQRLSVQPVTESEFATILEKSGGIQA